MEQIDVDNWESFEQELNKLRDNSFLKEDNYARVSPFLFRGVTNSNYQLSTTLERYVAGDSSFFEYHNLISRIQPQVETFTGKTWPIRKRDEFEEASTVYDHKFITGLWGVDEYSYMIYLRHHGFPSPLLDWTRSLYIAAYFAFRSINNPESGRVSIYVFCEYFGGGKLWTGDKARITGCGPYVRSHKRHFLQQGEYTICHIFKNGEWFYVPHEQVFECNNSDQDVLWKFTIPWTERTKVLKLLDNHNLNAFSLFDTEETLMETMALRELTFRS